MSRIFTAQEIFDELVNVDRIKELTGQITFKMGKVSIETFCRSGLKAG